MAITPTVSRSRQNDFVEAKKDENQIKSLIENGTEGDRITLHAGDFKETDLSVTTPIDIPEEVYVTILNGVVLEDKDPTKFGEPFPVYDIFTGHTENIADLRQTNWDNFRERSLWAIETAQDLALNDTELESIEVPGPSQYQTFSANKNGNGEVFIGELDKNKLVYATTNNGQVDSADDLVYDGNRFDVNTDQRISQSLNVKGHTKSGTASATNLDDNRIVVADTRSGRKGTLVDYKQFTFDGTEFDVGSSQNTVETTLFGSFLLNKNSSPREFHINPNVGGIVEGCLAVNNNSLGSSRALQVLQGSKSVAFYTETNSSKGEVYKVDNENDTILLLDGEGKLSVKKLDVEDYITTPQGEDLVLQPSTMTTYVKSDLVASFGLTVIGDALFYDNLLRINAGGSGPPSRNSGLVVDRGNKKDVDIRWNESKDEWEFTNDGVTYESFSASQFQVGTKVIDDTVASGNSRVLDLSTLFSPSTNTDQTILRTYVKDTTPGSSTNGEYINAHAVATTVRRNDEYEVYNEHSSSLDFRFVLKKF